MTAEVFLFNAHLKKDTMQNFFLPTFMNSDSLMFSGCIQRILNIHQIECKRKFHKIEYSGIVQEKYFDYSAKIF